MTFLCRSLLFLVWILTAEAAPPPNINKLVYMYHFFYYPFSIDFREGNSVKDVIPYIFDSSTQSARILKSDEVKLIQSEWAKIRAPWKKRSLFLTTPIVLGETKRITQTLILHKIPLTRGSLSHMSIDDRIQIQALIKDKPPEVQANFHQLLFLKSFLHTMDDKRFNFFIVSPHWCQSSREYQMLIETYFKTFPNSEIHIHSIVIEDPKESLFGSRILKELFPHPERYTHDNVPRFLALDSTQTDPQVYEEGEALQVVYDRYLAKNRGYLDDKLTFFKQRSLSSKRRPPK